MQGIQSEVGFPLICSNQCVIVLCVFRPYNVGVATKQKQEVYCEHNKYQRTNSIFKKTKGPYPGRTGKGIGSYQSWTCYNRTKLRETQQNQGFALI